MCDGSERVKMRALEIEPLEVQTMRALKAEMKMKRKKESSPTQEDLQWAIDTLARFIEKYGATSGGPCEEAVHILSRHIDHL
jgi:hypothetical protein